MSMQEQQNCQDAKLQQDKDTHQSRNSLDDKLQQDKDTHQIHKKQFKLSKLQKIVLSVVLLCLLSAAYFQIVKMLAKQACQQNNLAKSIIDRPGYSLTILMYTCNNTEGTYFDFEVLTGTFDMYQNVGMVLTATLENQQGKKQNKQSDLGAMFIYNSLIQEFRECIFDFGTKEGSDQRFAVLEFKGTIQDIQLTYVQQQFEKICQAQIKQLKNQTDSLTLEISNLKNTLANHQMIFEKDKEKQRIAEQQEQQIIEVHNAFNSVLFPILNDDFRQLIYYFGTPKIKAGLLYRGTRDGFAPADFHRMCDGKGPTLVLVRKSGNDKVFGGHTSTSWGSNNQYAESLDSFLFSFISGFKYPIKDPQYAIYNNPHHGPIFGLNGYDFNINQKIGTSSLGGYSRDGLQNQFELTGTKDFTIDQIEVYNINKF